MPSKVKVLKRKAFLNKKTGQLSVTIPKKGLKKNIKFFILPNIPKTFWKKR